MVATALSVKARPHGHADAAGFAKIDEAIERVRKAIECFEEISRFATTVKTLAEKILERARITKKHWSRRS